jgi:CheY-like chemotaxis protein
MKVLVATGDVAVRRKIAQWLAAASHTVIEAGDASTARSAAERGPEVVVVDWALPGGGGASTIKHLRAHDGRRHYVIAIAARPQPWDITAFFAAGADDFTSLTAPKEEIVARVEGLSRIRSWIGSQAREFELDAAFNLDRVRIWRELDAIVDAEVGEMLGAPLRHDPAACAAVQCAGTVPLSLTTEHLELRFSVGIAADASGRFAHEVLGGEAGRDAINDAIREIANVAGGAIKRAALGDGIAMTIGIPTNENVFDQPGVRSWTAATPSGLQLAFGAIALTMQARSVRRSELREGMVLAGDVRNAGGMLLVAAGSRLTTATVDRLARFLDSSAPVEISDVMPLQARGSLARVAAHS